MDDELNQIYRELGLRNLLTELGINARAEALRKAGQPETDRLLLAALERLCAPAHMGQIFKVALLVPAGDGLPPGFATIGDTA